MPQLNQLTNVQPTELAVTPPATVANLPRDAREIRLYFNGVFQPLGAAEAFNFVPGTNPRLVLFSAANAGFSLGSADRIFVDIFE